MVHSLKLLTEVWEYRGYARVLKLKVQSETPSVIVEIRIAAATNSVVSGDGGKTLVTKPSDNVINAAKGMSTLVVAHVWFLIYAVTTQEILNCTHIGKREQHICW